MLPARVSRRTRGGSLKVPAECRNNMCSILPEFFLNSAQQHRAQYYIVREEYEGNHLITLICGRRGGLPGAVAGSGRGDLAIAGLAAQEKERLSSQLGDAGVGVAQKRDQNAKPVEFMRFHADQDGFGHE
jgi:hypothetical protein